MEYLPPKVRKIDLSFQGFTGEFDAARIPRKTTIFFCGDNSLKDSVCTADLTNELLVLSLFDNALSGTLDFTFLPDTLLVFDVTDNRLFGFVDLRSIQKPIVADEGGAIANDLWDDKNVDSSILYLDLQGNEFEAHVRVDNIGRFQDSMVFGVPVTLVDSKGNRSEVHLID